MNCIKKVFKNLQNIIPVLLATLFCCASYAQTFDELYDSSTNFYSQENYEKISSREDGVGKSWTVLMYDLGLDSAGGHGDYQLFSEISKLVTSPKMHFLIQTRNTRGNVVRYRFFKGAVTSVFEKKSFADLKEALVSFIQWGKKSYAADKYVLVIRGLGSSVANGITWDGFDNRVMTLNDLTQGLAESEVDMDMVILDTGFSSCLETAYAISPYSKYLLASQDLLPSGAIDYKKMTSYMNTHLNASSVDVAKVVIDSCVEKNDRTSLAVTNLSKIGPVFTAFTKAADEMTMTTSDIETLGGLSHALSKVQEFGHFSANGNSGMVDLCDFALLGSDYLAESTTELLDAVYDAIEYEGHGYELGNACGLSVYYPKDATSDELSSYAENFGCGPFLSYLDAVFDYWTAPSWVNSAFGKKESGKIPSQRNLFAMKSRMFPVTFSEKFDDGNSSIAISSGLENILRVDFCLLYVDPKSSGIFKIENCSAVDYDDQDKLFSTCYDGSVLTVDGKTVTCKKVESAEEYEILLVPVKHNGIDSGLVIRHSLLDDVYSIEEIYPCTKNGSFVREPSPLNAGDELKFLFPAQFGIETKEVMAELGAAYYSSEIAIEKSNLPDGFYMGFFSVEDLFGNLSESMGNGFEMSNGFIFTMND